MSEAQNVVNADPKVREAGANVAAAVDRIKNAEAAIKDCEDALAKANARADSAAHTDDASALVTAVEEADLALRRAHVVLRVAAAQKRHAVKVYADAVHHATDEIHAQARAERLEACKQMDSANAALAEAMQRFAEATSKIHDTHAAGRVRLFDDSLLGPGPGAPHGLRPVSVLAQAEQALWG
jgi:chromosome segregation ATPase